MASLTIKGIPEELLARLRVRAKGHRRSINSEVIYLLERSVGAKKLDVDGVLTRIRRVRGGVDVPSLTEARLQQAIDEGRP
ncbi:MAG: Arc family DNA-binding protein [Gemmatimonadota bacterium]